MRSFLNVKKVKISSQSMRAAAQEYATLMEEERLAFSKLGDKASIALRTSANPYPAHSNAALRRQKRRYGAEQSACKRLCSFKSALSAEDRVQSRARRAARSAEQRLLHQACTSIRESVLDQHHILEDHEAVCFQGLHHFCSALQVSLRLEDYNEKAPQDLGSLNQLAQEWNTDHIGILPGSPKVCPPETVKLCWREGSCWCSRNMKGARAMLVQFTKAVKELVSTLSLQSQLAGGDFIFYCHGTAPGAKSGVQEAWCHVPLRRNRG